MNHIVATVSEIQNHKSLHIVKFECNYQTLSMMSLDLSDNIKVSTKVKLVVKPSHIAIAKKCTGDVSYSNQLSATIKSIDNGELLSSIRLSCFDTTLESIITVSSSLRMDLRVGDSVTLFIKASELSIGEVLDA